MYGVEGIVCSLYLRSRGLQSLAVLGSSLTPYVQVILSRFGRRLCVIPDNDMYNKSAKDVQNTAGEGFVKSAKRKLPSATVIQSIIAKDIDDSRQVEGKEDILLQEILDVMTCPFKKFTTIRVR